MQPKSPSAESSPKSKNKMKAREATPIRSQTYPSFVAFESLVASLRFVDNKKTKITIPLVVLAFDEAHTMTRRHTTPDDQWSVFNEMRHALRRLQALPLFSVFLSTTGKISQFTSTMRDDISKRVVEGKLIVIQPYTDIGFDPLANIICADGTWTLEQLTQLSQMTTQGRPMYVLMFCVGPQLFTFQ
jgi:hypothetical protein